LASSVPGVAVVGCGLISQRHLDAFRQLGADIAWVVDTSPERREAAARRYGARATARIEEALADPAVEAVDLCLPHNLHAPVAVQALDAQRHVLCEKPLAMSLEEADAMIEAADRAGRVLMVAENVWFEAGLLKIRELLASGAIGTVSLVQISRDVWTSEEDLAERPWSQWQKTAGGGIMIFGGVHDFEKARMLFGEISHLSAARAPQRLAGMEGDDTSVALMRFTSGAVGTMVESFSAMTPVTSSGAELHTLRVDGSRGSIMYEGGGQVHVFSSPAATRASSVAGTVEIAENDTFRAEIEHFFDCIRSGREPVTSARSQRRPLELVLAAYRSMDEGGMRMIDVANARPPGQAFLEAPH
jgi:predicted dehydrogenase